jgi:hypothetical protein
MACTYSHPLKPQYSAKLCGQQKGLHVLHRSNKSSHRHFACSFMLTVFIVLCILIYFA